jgi:hypothetical protein
MRFRWDALWGILSDVTLHYLIMMRFWLQAFYKFPLRCPRGTYSDVTLPYLTFFDFNPYVLWPYRCSSQQTTVLGLLFVFGPDFYPLHFNLWICVHDLNLDLHLHGGTFSQTVRLICPLCAWTKWLAGRKAASGQKKVIVCNPKHAVSDCSNHTNRKCDKKMPEEARAAYKY